MSSVSTFRYHKLSGSDPLLEHYFPDLTAEQKQSMREISNSGEGVKYKYLERNVHKKRKCDSSRKQYVQTAAQEFLEKASRELLGHNKADLKGPLQPRDSDEEESDIE